MSVTYVRLFVSNACRRRSGAVKKYVNSCRSVLNSASFCSTCNTKCNVPTYITRYCALWLSILLMFIHTYYQLLLTGSSVVSLQHISQDSFSNSSHIVHLFQTVLMQLFLGIEIYGHPVQGRFGKSVTVHAVNTTATSDNSVKWMLSQTGDNQMPCSDTRLCTIVLKMSLICVLLVIFANNIFSYNGPYV